MGKAGKGVQAEGAACAKALGCKQLGLEGELREAEGDEVEGGSHTGPGGPERPVGFVLSGGEPVEGFEPTDHRV